MSQTMVNMNKRLDEGFKLTNASCQKCSGVTLMKPQTSILYCPRCDSLVQAAPQEEQADEDDEFYNQIVSQTTQILKPELIQQDIRAQERILEESRTRTDAVSKKIGEKLMKGWTMLSESCITCNVPLMQSRTGAKICCSCEKDFQKVKSEVLPQPQPQTQPLPQTQTQPISQTLAVKYAEGTQNAAKADEARRQKVRELVHEIEVKLLQKISKEISLLSMTEDFPKIQELLEMTFKIKRG